MTFANAAIYGVTSNGGVLATGDVFALTEQNGAWIYADEHNFGSQTNPGGLVIKGATEVIGVTGAGGASRLGAIYSLAF
jgi:hypothetical protein